jgi:hypothetical protein
MKTTMKGLIDSYRLPPYHSFINKLFIVFRIKTTIEYRAANLTPMKNLLILIFATLVSTAAFSQRFSAGSGDWNQTSTWSATSGGAGGASVPTAGQTVTIERGHTVNLTANAACASIQLGGAATNNAGSITFSVGTITLTVSGNIQLGNTGDPARDGNITFQSGSTVSATSIGLGGTGGTPGQGAINMTAGGTLSVAGAFTVNPGGGTWTPGAGLVRLSGASTLPATVFNTFNNLTINGGTTSLGANITVTGALNITAGSLDANTQTNTITGLTTVSGSGTYQASTALQAFNGGLTIGGGIFTGSTGNVVATNVIIGGGTLIAPSGTFEVSGNWSRSGGTFTPGTNTVTFTLGSGTQTIAGVQTFNNLAHTGAGTVQLLNNGLTVGGTFLNSAGSFDANSLTNIVTGLTSFTGGNYLASTTLQTFNGGVTLSGGTFTGSTGGVTATNIVLNSGTFIAPSGAFNVSGNWSNNGGTFVPGTNNTVTFNGTGAQAINGSEIGQTFNNITIAKTAGTTLTVSGSTTTLNVAALTQTTGNFTAPATLNATGALTLAAGTYTAGANTNLENNFTNNGGTFTAGSSIVTFTGAGVKTIAGTNGTTATFYDLVIASGTALFGNNNTARTINISNNLTVSSGGSFSSGATNNGAHTINLTGNLLNDGIIDFSANPPSAHRLILLGATKTISGTGTNTFQNLRLSTTAAANVNINRSVRINGLLDWSTDGLLVLNASDVTFGNTATVAGSGAARYIQSDGTSSLTGQVLKVNNATAATWQFVFPIGTTTNGYSPLDLTAATINTAPTLNSTLAAKAITSVDETGKLKRTFRMTVAGNVNATTFTNARFNYYNPTDVSGLEPIASYTTLWYQKESNGIWTSISGTVPGTVNTAPTLSFFSGPTSIPQPLTNDTYYFTIGTPGAFGQTWYSYQTGNWNNPLSWTADGSSFPLLVNPTNAIPSAGDNVVITSGKTITMNVNGTSLNSINVIGTLNLLASTGHTYTTIAGSGVIRIAGASDNFPTGTATNFADNSVGGTLEITGGGILLSNARTFNNVVINMSADANAAVLKNNITINGDLTITRGLLQFENATAPSDRTLTVNGNVTVAASGGIRTFGSTNRHEFNFFGDFANDGISHFTNRSVADYSNEATDGIVDANFRNASRDQQILCNGETRFYRVEIDKGTDDTYTASISASSAANFNLFGPANYNINGASGTNDNALGLIAGTVELGNNVTVLLNNNGNYSIFQAARLWINGAIVTKTGNAIVAYGTVKIKDGSLTVLTDGGITLRDNGVILVEGGLATLGTIRTSTNGANSVGSYIQSGGEVTIVGPEQASYAMFSLTYPSNVFNMSGGTLTVQNRGTLGTRGAIFINSNPANISITGGTVIMEANNTNVYRITSRASFWNVIMRATGGTRAVQLLGTTSGTGTVGVDELTVAIQPLIVLNDFTIESNVTFTTNSADVTVGGNFEIQNGGTYAHGTNTTTINGGGVSSLIFGSTTTTQSFNNLIINKTNATDEVVITTGRPSPDAAIQVNGTFTFTKGIFDYKTFIASARATVSIASGITVGKSGTIGKLLLNGTTDQILNSSAGSIYNVELNNTDASPVITLGTGNLTVLGTLTMTSGIFDINTRKLTLSGAAANISGTGFSATKMIQSTANASDGGLELYLNANETLTFPIGVSGKYTPATATFTSFSVDRFVNIIPVNGPLLTTNLSGGDLLGYYWRVKYSNLTSPPLVSYSFTYVNGDVVGTESSYVPGKVLAVSPFTRFYEDQPTPNFAQVDETTKTITFNGAAGAGFAIENANYTAGASARFTGAPTVYYYANGATTGALWNAASTWSSTRGGTGGAGIPVAGDIVVMRRTSVSYSGVVTIPSGYTANAAQVVFDDENGFASGCPRIQFQTGTPFNSNLGVVEVAATHQGGTLNGDLHGAVILYNVDNTYAGQFPSGDFGGFNNYLNALVIYEWQSGTGTITLSSAALEYPQLWFQSGSGSRIIKFPNVSVNVKGRAYITGANQVMANDGANSVVLNFQRNLEIGSGCCGGGTFLFPGFAGASQTVQVDGNIVSTTGGGRSIQILNPATGTLTHKLIVKGDIGIVAGAVMNLGSGSAAETNVNLELQGNTNNGFTNAGIVTLSRIVMNKGNSVANSFTFNDTFTLTGATNGVSKAIELQNGLLVLNRTSGSPVTLTSGGGNFNIPGSAGLEVRSGTVQTSTTSLDANITLDGLLRVSGTGIINIDGGAATNNTNYIQYSNSGNATIEVTGASATLIVAGQIRRDLASATGVLKYTQSAGTVRVGNESPDTNLRGVFEVLNPGSQFNHSGGNFTVVRGNGSASVPSFWLEPSSASITSGSTITIGNASTPAGTIGLQSTVALNNLTIAGLAANTPQVSMYVTPLTVNGILSVDAGNTLNALGRDLTIGGNFTVNGTYIPGTNTTTFTNTSPSVAAINGAVSALSFYNFTKTGTGEVGLSRNINVTRDLKASGGVLSTGAFAINLSRNAEVDATISSTSGNGLVFGSTLQQQRLTRSVSGTGTLGIVTINNVNGVIIPDGNGYDFNISNNLRLQSGVFDIGGSLLFLQTSALITPVSAYSGTNLIQTNSSFTDKGVRKQFPSNYTADFIFPVGQSTYTPVTFNFSAGNTTGSSAAIITVRPSNRIHPIIVNDAVGEPPVINDFNNVLQYYWIIGATNVASDFKSSMALQYVQPLVLVENPYAESDYIAARILTDLTINPSLNISKFSSAEVNEGTNVITFPFATVVDGRSIAGEYFAGVSEAIPNNVPTYTTENSGDVGADIYDSPVFGGVPNGARIVVSPGHQVNFDLSAGSVILFQTVISAGAKIVIPSGSIGHSLGTLTGSGDLEINSDGVSAVLPAAEYDTFFSCPSGGGLIFGGTGNYEILGGIAALRNLTLNGTGDKSLSNNNITICNNFTINSGSFFNSSNRVITVQNDVLLNDGSFTNGAGTLTITRDFIQTNGVFQGGTGGTKTISRNLEINGGTFNPGSGSANIIRVNGNMTLGASGTITTGSSGAGGQRFLFGGTSGQFLTGDFTGTKAFNRLEISNSAGLTLVGDVTINSQLLLTNGLITPGASRLLLTGTATANPLAGSATSFVNGKLYKIIPNAGTSGDFTFPIGKGSRWRSAQVLDASAAGVTWDMEYFGGAATGAVAAANTPRRNPVSNFTSADVSVLRIAAGEYWRVSDGSSSSNGRSAKVGLSWGIESDVSANLAQREAMTVMSWNGINWTNNGGQTFVPGGTHTQSRGSFESADTLRFSENIVTLGSTEVANPLPIELIEFVGKNENGVNILSWRTATEINNEYFQVERSIDGETFTSLDRIKGNGTTNVQKSYAFTDEDPFIGRNYYRLKQVDINGEFTYSQFVIRVDNDGTGEIFALSVYPNPATSTKIFIHAQKSNEFNSTVVIRDITGKVLYSYSIGNAKNSIQEINLKEAKSGMYLIELNQGVKRVFKRLVIE